MDIPIILTFILSILLTALVTSYYWFYKNLKDNDLLAKQLKGFRESAKAFGGNINSYYNNVEKFMKATNSATEQMLDSVCKICTHFDHLNNQYKLIVKLLTKEKESKK